MQALIMDCNPFSACYVPCNALFEKLLLYVHIIQDFCRCWSIFWYTTRHLAHCSNIKCLLIAPYSFLWFQLLAWIQYLNFMFPGLWSIAFACSWDNLEWHKTYDSDNSFYFLKCVWYQSSWNFKFTPLSGNSMTSVQHKNSVKKHKWNVFV